ncbi:MAG: hypothetical protein JO032_06640 [Alphaproteobacteria bacterium]|nr:hypothetical protein [Alphaproteobacteria bacterium]MBV9552453.1 hypothetical protein [Alphaproteobacteria bacterium]
MRRLIAAALAVAAGVGAAAAAKAQLYPPFPASTQSLYDLYPPLSDPFVLSDTARRSVSADPGCGSANPQGGIPSAVTWGGCP